MITQRAMTTQPSLPFLSRPSNNLDPDCAIYDGSISCARFYFNTLKEAEIINHSVHTAGFDVDQIWMQSRLLLETVWSSGHFTRQAGPDIESEPPAKRAKHDKKPELTDSTRVSDNEDPGHSGFDKGDHIFPESATCGTEADRIASSSPIPENLEKSRGKAPNRLDDGFFSIDAFNIETENFERADELGKSFGTFGAKINWHADLNEDPNSDSEDHNIMYTDFFLPPKSLEDRDIDMDTGGSQGKRSPIDEFGYPGGFKMMMNEIEEDLFDEGPGSTASDLRSSISGASEGVERSSHGNIQARLNNRIRELEHQNISEREWTLSGETNSKQRPFNSLLEEDLDFERIGKPVPVVTQESTTTLEDMIKGRVLTGRFDEILRKTFERDAKFQRPIVELDDSKPRVGLAEVYEQENLELRAPAQPKSVDAKTNALRSEISGLFSVVSNQLDMLSSWHFTPKAPQSTLSIVQDARTLNMEEAQVNSNNLSMPMSMTLAPQEVYDPTSTAHQADGIIKVSGIPISLSEVKRSRRTKEKGRRGQEVSDPSSNRNLSNENMGMLRTLRQADVTVIDKYGKQMPLAGGPRTEGTPLSGSRVKL